MRKTRRKDWLTTIQEWEKNNASEARAWYFRNKPSDVHNLTIRQWRARTKAKKTFYCKSAIMSTPKRACMLDISTTESIKRRNGNRGADAEEA